MSRLLSVFIRYLLCSMPRECNGLIHHVAIWAHFAVVAVIVVVVAAAKLSPHRAY